MRSNYTEILPCQPLKGIVSSFWFFQGTAEELYDETFPDGFPEIIMHPGTTVYRANRNSDYVLNPQIEFIPQLTKPYRIKAIGKNLFFGIRFYPHAFSRISRVNMSELIDSIQDTKDVLYCEFTEIQDLLEEQKPIPLIVSRVEQLVLKKIIPARQDRKFDVLAYTIPKMLSGSDNMTLDDIVRATGVNARGLQRIFNERVGLNARLLFKIFRFQRSFKSLADRNLSMAGAAYECGYSDQAHFIRDFKQLTGITPAIFCPDNHPINRNFLLGSSFSSC